MLSSRWLSGLVLLSFPAYAQSQPGNNIFVEGPYSTAKPLECIYPLSIVDNTTMEENLNLVSTYSRQEIQIIIKEILLRPSETPLVFNPTTVLPPIVYGITSQQFNSPQ